MMTSECRVRRGVFSSLLLGLVLSCSTDINPVNRYDENSPVERQAGSQVVVLVDLEDWRTFKEVSVKGELSGKDLLGEPVDAGPAVDSDWRGMIAFGSSPRLLRPGSFKLRLRDDSSVFTADEEPAFDLGFADRKIINVRMHRNRATISGAVTVEDTTSHGGTLVYLVPRPRDGRCDATVVSTLAAAAGAADGGSEISRYSSATISRADGTYSFQDAAATIWGHCLVAARDGYTTEVREVPRWTDGERVRIGAVLMRRATDRFAIWSLDDAGCAAGPADASGARIEPEPARYSRHRLVLLDLGTLAEAGSEGGAGDEAAAIRAIDNAEGETGSRLVDAGFTCLAGKDVASGCIPPEVGGWLVIGGNAGLGACADQALLAERACLFDTWPGRLFAYCLKSEGDGPKTVTVQFLNRSSSLSTPMARVVKLDQEPPANLSLDLASGGSTLDGMFFAKVSELPLRIDADDMTSPRSEWTYEVARTGPCPFAQDGGASCDATAAGSFPDDGLISFEAFPCRAEDCAIWQGAEYTLRAKVRDAAGNEVSTEVRLVFDPVAPMVRFRAKEPPACSLLSAGNPCGSDFLDVHIVRSNFIPLQISDDEDPGLNNHCGSLCGPYEVALSNDYFGVTTARRLPFQSEPYNWRLTAEDGEKTVFARVFDRAGNYTDISFSARLDTTSPKLTTAEVLTEQMGISCLGECRMTDQNLIRNGVLITRGDSGITLIVSTESQELQTRQGSLCAMLTTFSGDQVIERTFTQVFETRFINYDHPAVSSNQEESRRIELQLFDGACNLSAPPASIPVFIDTKPPEITASLDVLKTVSGTLTRVSNDELAFAGGSFLAESYGFTYYLTLSVSPGSELDDTVRDIKFYAEADVTGCQGSEASYNFGRDKGEICTGTSTSGTALSPRLYLNSANPSCSNSYIDTCDFFRFGASSSRDKTCTFYSKSSSKCASCGSTKRHCCQPFLIRAEDIAGNQVTLRVTKVNDNPTGNAVYYQTSTISNLYLDEASNVLSWSVGGDLCFANKVNVLAANKDDYTSACPTDDSAWTVMQSFDGLAADGCPARCSYDVPPGLPTSYSIPGDYTSYYCYKAVICSPKDISCIRTTVKRSPPPPPG